MRTQFFRIPVLVVAVLMVVGFAGPVAADPPVCSQPTTVEAFNDLALFGGAEGVAVARNGDVFFGVADEGLIFKAPKGDFAAAFVLADLVPDGSFGGILSHTFAIGIHNPEVKLGVYMPLVCSVAIPFCRLGIIHFIQEPLVVIVIKCGVNHLRQFLSSGLFLCVF